MPKTQDCAVFLSFNVDVVVGVNKNEPGLLKDTRKTRALTLKTPANAEYAETTCTQKGQTDSQISGNPAPARRRKTLCVSEGCAGEPAWFHIQRREESPPVLHDPGRQIMRDEAQIQGILRQRAGLSAPCGKTMAQRGQRLESEARVIGQSSRFSPGKRFLYHEPNSEARRLTSQSGAKA
jgi:hypothetical protein